MTFPPPPGFSRVEHGIFRSAVFVHEHFEFVKRLRLKTILYVSPDYLLKSLLRFTQDHGIKLINLVGQENWTDVDATLRSELVKQALELILNADNHPILVMCTTGLHHTGAILGALRQLQGWSFTSIIEEFRRFGTLEVRVQPMVEHFIERFDVDLVTLPANLPWWLMQEQALLTEEEASVR